VTAFAEAAPDLSEAAIGAVGVVVPARDEQARITACLTSVRHALAALPEEIDVAVAVVLDRCTDATPERVAAVIADWLQAVAVTVCPVSSAKVGIGAHVPVLPWRPRGSGVGALRDLGVREVLHRLATHRAATTWLLSTDADTVVPADWVLAHLRLAHDGAHAVAGLADLVGVEHLASDALLRYRAIVARGVRGDVHGHVYGANLGVRADAYLAVGGFPPDGGGEDHGLWQRLRVAGYRLVQPVGVRVRTSARLRGRAEDGLAGLLRSLHHIPTQHLSAHPPTHQGPAHGGEAVCVDIHREIRERHDDRRRGGPVRGGA
jgi:hypothetical protein